jgi:hypothetical protein
MSLFAREGLEAKASREAEVYTGKVEGTEGEVKVSRSKVPPNAAILRPDDSVRTDCLPVMRIEAIVRISPGDQDVQKIEKG